MDTTEDRKPFTEVQNLLDKGRVPFSSGPRKTGITKSSSLYNAQSRRVAEKKSNIPRCASVIRRQTGSGIPPRKPETVPVPSRVTTAPKRAGPTRRQNIAATPGFDTARRRATTSMTFTQSGERVAMAAGKRPAKVNQEVLELINSKQDDIIQKVSSLSSGQGNEDTTMRLDAEEIRLQIESMANKFHSSQNERDLKFVQMAEEKLEIKSQLVEAKNNAKMAEVQLEQEKTKVAALEEKISELKASIASIEGGTLKTQNGMYQASEKVERLQQKLRNAEEECARLESERVKLHSEVKSHSLASGTLESEMGTMTIKLKELQRRLEVSESDCAARDSDVRRIRKEKETAGAERDELEASLRKKTCTVQEQKKRCEELEAEVQRLRGAQDELKKGAESDMNALKVEASSRMKALQHDFEEAQRFGKVCSAELENRKNELSHMREAVSLQESNLSRVNCEKMNLEAKVEALHAEIQCKVGELTSLRKQREEQNTTIKALEEQAREDATLRRKLHNAIQELKGNIRVFCRVRPLLPQERETSALSDAQQMFEYNEKGQGVVARPPSVAEGKNSPVYPFKYDRVFGPDCGQDAVFEEISQLVQSALDGYRVCIFAYGQTGSGKTHTMIGEKGSDESKLGMIPRSVRQVFDTAKQLEKDQWTFTLKASFLEIYNEAVRDLLVNNNSANAKSKAKEEKYRVVFNSESRLSTVVGMTTVDVENEQQLQKLIAQSLRNRATAATQANDRSSRSHSVFRLHIEGQNSATGQKTMGLLNLIDLAGSERLTQSKAEGDRLRETRHINKSLSALGDVIAAIANSEKHVPFRNSKLTHVLQDSLGGDSKTLMFVNVSHAPESFNESLCSLRFAAKVNSCHVGTARRTARIEF